jgi:uridine kinase
MLFTFLSAAIQERRNPGGTTLVAIDGPGGSGKSVLANALADRNQAITVISVDDFYLPDCFATQPPAGCDQPSKNFDLHRLYEQVLRPLRDGQPATYQRYDWVAGTLAEWHAVLPGQTVIVEGIYSLAPGLRQYYDLSVWIDCPRSLRLAHGLARDGEGAREMWTRVWMPAEDRYIRSFAPEQVADIVLCWQRSPAGGYVQVLRHVSRNLQTLPESGPLP